MLLSIVHMGKLCSAVHCKLGQNQIINGVLIIIIIFDIFVIVYYCWYMENESNAMEHLRGAFHSICIFTTEMCLEKPDADIQGRKRGFTQIRKYRKDQSEREKTEERPGRHWGGQKHRRHRWGGGDKEDLGNDRWNRWQLEQ